VPGEVAPRCEPRGRGRPALEPRLKGGAQVGFRLTRVQLDALLEEARRTGRSKATSARIALMRGLRREDLAF
jgi:hypothetical protein